MRTAYHPCGIGGASSDGWPGSSWTGIVGTCGALNELRREFVDVWIKNIIKYDMSLKTKFSDSKKTNNLL